jgi:hypothetical protein
MPRRNHRHQYLLTIPTEPAMSLEVLSIGSSNLVRLDALTNASTGAYVNDATVTFTLKDAAGSVVSGLANVSMPYVAASNGRYEGIIPSSAALALNALCTLEITTTSGSLVLFRRLSCVAKYRSEW